MKHYKMVIGGELVEAAGGARFESDNPYDGQPWASFPRAGEADVDAAVEAAHRALTTPAWRDMTPTARGALMYRIAEMLPSLAPDLGAIETRDNGKLIGDTRGEALFLANVFRYYAGLADKIEGILPPAERPGSFAFAKYQPIGVVAVITPWNSPLLIAGMKAANALAAGCPIVIKPSEFTSASTIEFAELFRKAGFPDGVVNVITGYGSEVGERLVTHPKVTKVTFTGGTATGKRINQLAAGSFKKTVLELGGKSANIVFDDADIEQAVRGAIVGIFTSSGQTCIAGSRLLLHDAIHDRFMERLIERVGSLRLGDPFDPATQIGPISTRPHYERVLEYLDIAKGEGARCVLGGEALPGKGQLVRPTIFADVDNRMRVAQEEIFGPILSVIRFRSEDEAVEIANGTDFGLAGAAWTADIGRAFRMIDRIEAGTIWINTYRPFSFMLPVTGYKQSGLGSENGQANLLSFLKAKSVYINHGGPVMVPFLED